MYFKPTVQFLCLMAYQLIQVYILSLFLDEFASNFVADRKGLIISKYTAKR